MTQTQASTSLPSSNNPYGAEGGDMESAHVCVEMEQQGQQAATETITVDTHTEVTVDEENPAGKEPHNAGPQPNNEPHNNNDGNNNNALGARGLQRLPIREGGSWKTNYFMLQMIGYLLLNVGAFVLIYCLTDTAEVFEHSGTMATVNLLVLTMWRNEFFVCGLFWMARRCKFETVHRMVHNYGGVHASAGMCCLGWVLLSIGFGVASGAIPLVVLVLRIVIATLLAVVAGVGTKKLRRHFHNAFEIIHRYTSWLLLAILAADIIYQMPASGHTPVPYLWLGTLLFLLSSWLTVTKERCNIRLLSPSNKRILVVDMPDVKYRGSGLAMKLSRDGVEWHSFAVCPSFYHEGASMCVIAAAGDWTGRLIDDCVSGAAPEHIYTRSMFPGFMNSTNTYTRIACVGTGAGIAPILATINTPGVDMKLLWVTNTKYDTQDIMKFLDDQKTPHHIFNTAVARPSVADIMAEVPEDVEAVFIVSNPEFTREMKMYCDERNVRCFGANWDS
eukprot:TRINITY_DN49_c0_g1_i1.p2 TRINITY_DN49_c0_g1~~TRINITY_DN49_c0_g1_i1.p2  ORF type:complete len:528 (+),score=229.50 TRINITY_DN49_c0_g1_i1:76-1584(+)